MKTIEEMLENVGVTTSAISGLQTYLKDDVISFAKQVAEYHVKEALKAIIQGAKVKEISGDNHGWSGTDSRGWNFGSKRHVVDEMSIVNAYHLSNIK